MPKKHDWFWLRVQQHLTSLGLKQTKQRRIVMEFLIRGREHVDAEGLRQDLVRNGHGIGLATVYRTLHLLRQAGVLEERTFGDGRSFFEIARPEEHHDHLICVDCGRVIEFEDHEIERLQEAVATARGFVLKSHRLNLYGSCIRDPCEHRPS